MEKKKAIVRTSVVNCVLALCVCVSTALTSGCETRGQTGALAGAGIGALAGQAIGGSTSGTLIGAAVGAGAGYIIGNEQDKKAAKNYKMTQPTSLTGTKWEVTSLVMDDKPEYERMILEFKPNGEVVTTIHEPGGTMVMTEERYRISGDTLIINKTDYIINARYNISGNRMTVSNEEFRAVLRKI